MESVENASQDPVEMETTYPTMADDFLDLVGGSTELEASHAGGEMADLVAAVEGERRRKRLAPPHFFPFLSQWICRHDHRTRRDRQERRTSQFNVQLSALVLAYLKWSCDSRESDGKPVGLSPSAVGEMGCVEVLDFFRKSPSSCNCRIDIQDHFKRDQSCISSNYK